MNEKTGNAEAGGTADARLHPQRCSPPAERCTSCFRKMRIFAPDKCASFPPKDAHLSDGKCASAKHKMRIRETEALHPRNGSPASVIRKPRIRCKKALRLPQERTASCRKKRMRIPPSAEGAHPPVKPLARISPADWCFHRRRPAWWSLPCRRRLRAWCPPPRRAAQSTPAAPCPRGRGCRRRCSGASVRG